MRERLIKRRAVCVADMHMKAEVFDWHGVADVAMDLREVDAQYALVNAVCEQHPATAASLDLKP